MSMVIGPAIAFAAPAGAQLTDVFSTTFLSAEASIEIAGVMDAATPLAEPFVLDQLGSIDLTRSVGAAIDDGSAAASMTATGAFSATASRIDIGFDATASANITPLEPDAFGFVKARVINITRFTSSTPVSIDVSGIASRSFDLFGSSEPELAQTLIIVNDEFNPQSTPFVLENPAGAIQETITLGPGSYQFQFAVDATFQLFGFPDDSYAADSALSASAAIVAIPAPGAAAILLAPALLRRRR
jgi:hypothetical protein